MASYSRDVVAPVEPLAAEDEPTTPDGRRARRDRNRDAVVDAFLDLLNEGDLNPGVAAVAERSGVSHRSVFRYFEDLEELFRVAIEHQADRMSELSYLRGLGRGTFDERVEAIIAHRIALYDATENVSRAARLRAPSQPILQASITSTRALAREQARVQFRQELRAMSSEDSSAALAAIDALLSFEAYDLYRNAQSRSRGRTASTLSFAIRRMLAPQDTTSETRAEADR